MCKLMNALINPRKIMLRAWKLSGMASFRSKLDYDLFQRPHYAYCLANAAQLAKALGVKRISALEFGVAGGRGLLELEALCPAIEQEYGIEIEIWGFDTGEGLPTPVDYRDLPYIWKEGFYRMDQKALRERLTRSKLVLGDVKETVPTFVEKHSPATIGVALFDLDFWSSTIDAFALFSGHSETMLPRVFCYCDDVISAEGGGVLSDDLGQLRAIRDYNEGSESRKLRPIAGLAVTRKVPATWNTQVYVHHIFDHKDYNKYIHNDEDRQLSIA